MALFFEYLKVPSLKDVLRPFLPEESDEEIALNEFPLLSLPVELILAVAAFLPNEADHQALRGSCRILRSCLPRQAGPLSDQRCYFLNIDYNDEDSDHSCRSPFPHWEQLGRKTKWKYRCQLYDFSSRLLRDLPQGDQKRYIVCSVCYRLAPASPNQIRIANPCEPPPPAEPSECYHCCVYKETREMMSTLAG